MTQPLDRDAFIERAKRMLSDAAIAQINDQIEQLNASGFAPLDGHTGPGPLKQLRRSVEELQLLELTLARLENRHPRAFCFDLILP